MEEFFKKIDKQFALNRGKNIFLDDHEVNLIFGEETINSISKINEFDIRHQQVIIEYLTDKAIEEFCRTNQYYSFSSQSKSDLRNIYNSLIKRIKSESGTLDKIRNDHYKSLKQWLIQYNSFAAKLYSEAENDIIPVVCSEYSAELQLAVLNINTRDLNRPVLDIGCGKQGILVKHLNNLGFEAIGIDRFSFTEKELITSDWLEFNYGLNKWGIIISHLSFSNHFKHHHLREDGNFLSYAKTFLSILKSLKEGGRFHYAPDLPFIEMYLDKNIYNIEKYEIGEFDFNTTVITRLK